MQNIGQDRLKGFWLAVPPSDEQNHIASKLDGQFETQEKLKCSLLAQVSRLREYRQSLITAAVTGQLEIPAEDYA